MAASRLPVGHPPDHERAERRDHGASMIALRAGSRHPPAARPARSGVSRAGPGMLLQKRRSRPPRFPSEAFPQVSAPGRIRTRDPLLRRQLLCPAELRAPGNKCARRMSHDGYTKVAVSSPEPRALFVRSSPATPSTSTRQRIVSPSSATAMNVFTRRTCRMCSCWQSCWKRRPRRSSR